MPCMWEVQVKFPKLNGSFLRTQAVISEHS